MFRVHNFCKWFPLIFQTRLLFKLISLHLIKLGFYGNGFTNVSQLWKFLKSQIEFQFLQCISYRFCRKKFTHDTIHRNSWFCGYLGTKCNFSKLYIHASSINYMDSKGSYNWLINSHSGAHNWGGEYWFSIKNLFFYEKIYFLLFFYVYEVIFQLDFAEHVFARVFFQVLHEH